MCLFFSFLFLRVQRWWWSSRTYWRSLSKTKGHEKWTTAM